MAELIFAQDNRVEVQYGVFGPASGRKHGGIDIDTLGDPTIHSTVSGRVKWARCIEKGATGWGNTWEWGWFVWIVDDNGFDHIFAHCKAYSLMVTEGQRVKAGQAIAVMGKTGNAAYDRQAEHVHYEVRRGGVAVDPTPWCGIPNAVGTTNNTAGATGQGNQGNNSKQEDDDMCVRIYGILESYTSQKEAKKRFEKLADGASDPREYLMTTMGNMDYADGKTRIMQCRMKRKTTTAANYREVRMVMEQELRPNEILV